MSEDEIQQLWDEIEDLNKRISSLEAKLDEQPEVVEDVLDIRSFVAEIDPGTHAERALAIGFYLEEYESQSEFTSGDIVEGYGDARLQEPANMSDVLGDCEDKGWMRRTGKSGQAQLRQLTQQGFEAVEEVLVDGT